MQNKNLKCGVCKKTLNKDTAGTDREKCNACKMKEWLGRAKLAKQHDL